MIKKILFLACLVFMSIRLFPQETIILQESKGINLHEFLKKNHIYIRRIQSADADENSLYLLDQDGGTVIRINKSTGQHINSISSKGQGPAELMLPSVVRVIHEKVFVLSQGHNSVKIFSITGNLLGEVKARRKLRWMDVDEKENIYMAESDSKANPIISVYDIEGKMLKIAVVFALSKEILDDKAMYFLHSTMKFRVDREGNIIVLNYLMRILKKIDSKGNLLWEKKIANPLIEPSIKSESVKSGGDGVTIHATAFDLDIDQEGNAYIGHAGGGCVYDTRGQLASLLEVQSTDQKYSRRSFFLIKVFNDLILGEYHDGDAYLFKYR